MKSTDTLARLHVDFPVALERQVIEICLTVSEVTRFDISGTTTASAFCGPPALRQVTPWQRRLRIVAEADVCARVAGALRDTLCSYDANFRIERYRQEGSV